jgi:copper(I)-binding protein
MKRLVLVTLGLAVFSAPALATVTVKEPWVRATTPHQKATMVFMQLTSSNDARLVKADSPVAKVVEIHKIVMRNNVMRMRTVPAIDLPAGKAVELNPSGYVVMLMGLKQQIKEGDTIPISLVIEEKNKMRQTLQLNASAMTMDAAASGKHAREHVQEHEHAHEHTN